jgi:hypothetical protein
MAFGRAGATGKALAARPSVNIDDYLLAEARNPRAPALPRRPAAPVRPAPMAVVPVQSAGVLESVDPSVEAGQTQLAAAEPPKAPADFDRYSSRAQNDSDLLKFQGGDAIVITASTLVIVLLVVLLLVLLT